MGINTHSSSLCKNEYVLQCTIGVRSYSVEGQSKEKKTNVNKHTVEVNFEKHN